MRKAAWGTRAIVLAVAGALTLTGCGGNSGSGAADGGGTGIVTANGSEPQNPLIPTNTNEVGGGRIVESIFAGLVSYDENGAPHNEIAESIETDDATTYTIKIRPDWTFTNGEKVTAQSFVDAWQYGALASNAQLNASWFENIEGFSADADSPLTGLTVIDDTTFTVTLTSPVADFPLRLGYSAYYPLPSVAYDDMEAFGQNPIGNGPYKLDGDSAWKHNESIALVPNPDYKGNRVPKNGGVTFKFYAQQEAAYADLVAGNLDVLDAVPPSAQATFQEDLEDRAVNQPAAIFQSFTIPARLPHFSGKEGELRRAAISHAINRAEITEVIFNGTRTPASDFTSPVIDGWSDTVPGSDVLDYDPVKAKELWAQADAISPWTGTFQIAFNTDGGHQAWVDAVANSLKNNLGIDAAGAPYATFKEIRTQVVDRVIATPFRTGWQADYPGLYNFLAPLYQTGGSGNDGDYSNATFDALLADGSASADITEANAKFQEAQEILFRELPVIPLWYSNVTGGHSANVSNVLFGWNSQPLYSEIVKK